MDSAQGIYAIYDKVAKDILGGLHLHRHPATAVRFFSDIARQQGSIIHAHPADFQLIRVGYLKDFSLTIELDDEVVLEGSAWAASQEPAAERPAPLLRREA